MKTNLNNNFGKFLLVIVTLILMGFIPALERVNQNCLDRGFIKI